MDLLSTAPYLVCQDFANKIYDGFLTVKDTPYRLRIILKEENSLIDAKLETGCDLRQLLKGYEKIIVQRMQRASSIAEFLVELKSLVENQLDNAGDESLREAMHQPKYFNTILEQVQEVGLQRLKFMDPNFSKIHFSIDDEAGRSHLIKFQLNSQHPSVAPLVLTSLPLPLDFKWKPTTRLLDVVNKFREALSRYQAVWTQLDRIDDRCWILEPDTVERSHCDRRIALGNSSSIKVSLNPLNPTSTLPEWRLMGSEKDTRTLKDNLYRNSHKWNPNMDVLENLEEVLQYDLPSKSSTQQEDFSLSCGICYVYRLADEIPDQVCGYTSCAQIFHHSCLYEWLKGLSTSNKSFNTIFGECPYCSKSITVQVKT